MTETLAAALAAFQAELPSIRKAETATVETKGGGRYTYTYANLNDMSAEVLPLLARHGLSWTCSPTLDDEGRFVLAYSLLHTSGEARHGAYPLPSGGTPQAQGSAITYARRYALGAITGVAPDDDDGQAAEQAAQRSTRPDPSPVAVGGEASATGDAPATSAPSGKPTHNQLLAKLEVLLAQLGDGEDSTRGARLREYARRGLPEARAAVGRLTKELAKQKPGEAAAAAVADGERTPAQAVAR